MQNEPQVDFNEPDTNQLQVIVQEASLPESKAKYILTKFQDYFNMADELAKLTTVVKVNDASQTDLMAMARTARLKIREKRLAVEKSRKELKADILREGRAIDGIANVLFALLEPLEVYFDKQENFVKYQEEAKAELIRIEVEKKMAEKEAADARAKEQEDRRIREENESLRQQAQEAEAIRIETERRVRDEQEKVKKENEAKIARERAEQQAKLDLVRKEQEAKLAKERLEQEKKLAGEHAERQKVEDELRAKKEAEQKAERERIAKEEALKKAGDVEKLTNLANDIGKVFIPIDLKSKESRNAVEAVEILLDKAITILRLFVKEEEVDF